MRICGIDPGLSGAFCFMTLNPMTLSSDEIKFLSMPTEGKDLDFEKLVQIFESLRDVNHVFIEKVSAMPGQGVSSMFKFGRCFGALQALACNLRVPQTLVTPQAWQKSLHAGISSKELPKPKMRSLTAAKRLFPNLELRRNERCKVADEGLVDSLLICEYGRRVLKQGLA